MIVLFLEWMKGRSHVEKQTTSSVPLSLKGCDFSNFATLSAPPETVKKLILLTKFRRGEIFGEFDAICQAIAGDSLGAKTSNHSKPTYLVIKRLRRERT